MIKGLLRVFAGYGLATVFLAPLADKAIRDASLEITRDIEKVLMRKTA